MFAQQAHQPGCACASQTGYHEWLQRRAKAAPQRLALPADRPNYNSAVVAKNCPYLILEVLGPVQQTNGGLKSTSLRIGNLGERGRNVGARDVEWNAAEHGVLADYLHARHRQSPA